MILEFLPKALAAFNNIKSSSPEKADRVKTLVKDILEHPDCGIGTPLQLQGKYSGVWIRRISFDCAVYYVFNEEKVLILSLESNLDREKNREFVSNRSPQLNIESFSEDEYASVMALMSANRGKGAEPKVGIFWYNRARNELFGVVSHKCF